MATARLSSASNILSGILVSQHSDTVTTLSVHPASPVLLTSNSPHEAERHSHNEQAAYSH